MKNFTLTLIALGASGLTTADANMAEAAPRLLRSS